MIPTLASVLFIVLAATQAEGAPDGTQGGEAARILTPELRIDTGMIRGLVVGAKHDVYVYKGIPYAARRPGERRWKPPERAILWEGVRDCVEFGAACPQKQPALFSWRFSAMPGDSRPCLKNGKPGQYARRLGQPSPAFRLLRPLNHPKFGCRADKT
jgi:hypothetical protein